MDAKQLAGSTSNNCPQLKLNPQRGVPAASFPCYKPSGTEHGAKQELFYRARWILTGGFPFPHHVSSHTHISEFWAEVYAKS